MPMQDVDILSALRCFRRVAYGFKYIKYIDDIKIHF